jgi:aerobic-type carbon monoxide dehydrogenase small subunit (CoxS/CutS family)
MPSLELFINGAPHKVDVPPSTPLLWVLRDVLNLTGTKYGCGIGQCGACMVHLENQAVRSCQVPVGSIGAKKIITIEGLADSVSLHPVQKAWIAEQVPQCGYCQPGQIMSAVALLQKTPHPDSSAIDNAMAGNLCRCATYFRIRKAIRNAAGERTA